VNLAIALAVAVWVAALGHVTGRVLRTTRLDALVITAVLAELAKKLTYLVVGVPDKRLSLVLSAPLLLAAAWWVARPRRLGSVRALTVPSRWLGLWFATLAVFTFLNPEGSLLVLASYLVSFLWLPAAAGLLGEAGRWTYRVLWVAVIVAFVNQAWGPDPLWRAYTAVAEPVSIGARYTPDVGYSGSIFSSQTELGAFTLAASALLAAGSRRPRGLLLVSLAAAVLTGQRYTMLGVVLFWLALGWSRLARLRPWQAVAAILAYSPLQDAVGRRILDSPPELGASASPFLERLFTVGTVSARVGFTEAWWSVLSQHWLVGIGLMNVFSPTATYPDDRHNLILWLLLRGGVVALVAYFGFVVAHFRRFGRAAAGGRVGMAFLLAALVMSMGGPHATSSWFFVALGALFWRATREGSRTPPGLAEPARHAPEAAVARAPGVST
jgi:hypothetical protein